MDTVGKSHETIDFNTSLAEGTTDGEIKQEMKV